MMPCGVHLRKISKAMFKISILYKQITNSRLSPRFPGANQLIIQYISYSRRIAGVFKAEFGSYLHGSVQPLKLGNG